MKAVDTCFFGAFTGNGFPLVALFANHDPIFFRVCVGEADLAITKTGFTRPSDSWERFDLYGTVTNNGRNTGDIVYRNRQPSAETTFVSCSSTGRRSL